MKNGECDNKDVNIPTIYSSDKTLETLLLNKKFRPEEPVQKSEEEKKHE